MTLQSQIESGNASREVLDEVIAMLDAGTLRVAEKDGDTWKVNAWVKTAIVQYFTQCEMREERLGDIVFRDKVPLKTNFENVRIVPGGNAVRVGSYLADGVIMMPPSYVNIGAYVGAGTMIDSNVLVGSCAQIGANVHLSAAVQVGGVLEPANAQPVIIEEDVFVGAGVIVVEGVLVRSGAVLAPGVVLSASTKILETDKEGKIINTFVGEVPENAIVVPGARARGEVMLQTPVIVGYKNQETAQKVELSDFLRDF